MAEDTEEDLDAAISLREAGHLDEARRVLERLIVQQSTSYGPKSYETQCAMSQLGRTLRVMGKASEASALHWEVLAIRLEEGGRDSFYTKNSASILADTLRNFLHDKYMAAAVERWIREPDETIDSIGVRRSLTGRELEQALRDRESASAQFVAGLIQEYLQQLRI